MLSGLVFGLAVGLKSGWGPSGIIKGTPFALADSGGHFQVAEAPRGICSIVGLYLTQRMPEQICSQRGCRRRKQLAICCFCLHWRCEQHRLIRNHVQFDQENKALGGLECVCDELKDCDSRIAMNTVLLGVGVGVSVPDARSGEGKGKHKAEKGKGKGKHKARKGKGDAKGKGKHKVKGQPENQYY